jgi:hypothetical protein
VTSQVAISNKKTRFGPKVASRDWWIERVKIWKPETRYWTHFTKYQIAQFKALAELDYQVECLRFLLLVPYYKFRDVSKLEFE